MAEELGTAVLRITVDDGLARKSLEKLRTDAAYAVNLASSLKPIKLDVTVDPKGLTQFLSKAKEEIQKTAKDLQLSLTAAPINPVTGRSYSSERNAPVKDRIQQRRAEQRSLQTAEGGGLTRFLRDIRTKEEDAKRASIQESKRLTDFEDRLAKTRAASTAATQKSVEAEREKAKASTQGRIASGLIGGGFPLLFGQGGGAAAGGLLGGLIGGGPFGFGASIVGTLLGSQVDLLNQRFGELSNALQDPIASFDVFIQKATLASKAQESLALALQETGQTTAAAELIRKEAARTIDPISAQSAVIAQDEFNRVLSDTQDVLGSIVSGPATGFLEFLTTTLRLVAGTPQESKIDPVTNAVKGAETASRKLGRNIGGILAGLGLAAGGIATTFATSGAGAGIGVPLIASGLSIAGIGAAGASAAEGDTRVATSQAVITAELAVTAAKERQVALEREILQARASGKKGLDEQVSLRAQFNALQVEELQGLSRIQQELARKKDGFNDLEDQATAIRQEKELRAAIELRRQALLAAASAAQTASVTDLKNAKQLVGKYGAEREILSTQLEIKSAVDAAYQAQLQLNKARKEGASTAEIEAAEKIVNTLINKRILTELEGAEKIRKIRKDITAEIQLQTAQFQIKSQAIERQIQNVTALGRVEQGAARDALLLRQQVTNEINAARDAESKIASSIQAARTRGGGELTQELRDLYKEQGIAGQQTELALKRGGLSLRDAASTLRKLGEKLYEDLSRAQVSLTEVRSDPAGLNKFLNRGQQIERARQDRTTLQPIFELAQRRFESFTGAEAPEFTGSLEGVNASMRDFINVVNREFDANQRVSDIQKALAENTAALSSINEKLNTTNEELTTQIVALTQKDWNVYLAANYSGNTLQELMKAATLP